jgi:hypothetical protein
MSQKSRRKRQQGSQWSAARAARAAVHMAAEFVQRYEHNPFLLAHNAGHFEQILDAYLQFFAEHGVTDRREAVRLALFQLGLDVSPDTPELSRVVARRRVEEEVSAVRTAEIYVVSPGMHAVVVAAAETLDRSDLAGLADPDDLPVATGFLLLPSVQLVQQGHHDQPSEIRALAWWLATVPTVEGPRVPVVKAVSLLAFAVRGDARRPGRAVHPDPGSRRRTDHGNDIGARGVGASWRRGGRIPGRADGPVQFPDFTTARRLAKDAGHPFPSLFPDSRPFMRLGHDPTLTDLDKNLLVQSERQLYHTVAALDDDVPSEPGLPPFLRAGGMVVPAVAGVLLRTAVGAMAKSTIDAG